jgi:uncharacterized protein involved in outer membrane biogenesis
MYVCAQSAAWCLPDNSAMTLPRSFLWIAGALIAPFALLALLLYLFGWNWLRGPIEHLVEQKTGRALVIDGDLTIHPGWPWPRLHASTVTFANPLWAHEKYMVAAEAVDITVDLPQLLQRHVVFPAIHMVGPVVFLEQSPQGQKNWLLDINQQDENARIQIGQLTLDHGTLGYDDTAHKTRIRSDVSSSPLTASGQSNSGGPGVAFRASGQYQGLTLLASGSGGPVLALRDDKSPYPLQVDVTIGHTRIQANGTVTGLLQRMAVDMRLAVSGDSLEQLYPVLGIPAPATRAYVTQGHLVHSGNRWCYEGFTGRIGKSDIRGTAQVITGGKRPELVADVTSALLDLADLGPVIGVRPASGARVPTGTPAPSGVLPEVPFKTERWNSVDADVRLHASHILRAKELPLDDLSVHLGLHDAVLTLDPLDVGVAGGRLNAVVSLDGRSNPMQAKARVQVQKVLLAKLFPTVVLNRTSIGQINGAFTLSGTGNSIRRMLATADGRVTLAVARGEVSQLMMEKAGLHLWEILELNVTGDHQITLRCALADFDVKKGVMNANTLVFDTEVTTLLGSGSIDLAHETLDLTLNQKTKNTSPFALRSPIFIRGSFAKPAVGVDKTRVVARAVGAVALSLVNPLLALIPLIDPGPGKDSDCGPLLQQPTHTGQSH